MITYFLLTLCALYAPMPFVVNRNQHEDAMGAVAHLSDSRNNDLEADQTTERKKE